MMKAFHSLSEPKIVTMAKESERKFAPVAIGDSAPGQEDLEELESNQIHLQMFVSYLEFWQDTLSHCKSEKIRSVLLEKFDSLFLQQLLIPFLAESADMNSGDLMIAVMTYLRTIFDTLQEADIINLILSALMTNSERNQSKNSKPGLDAEEDEIYPRRQTKATFNMADLIIESLESQSQQTVGAALRLVSTLIRKHYPYVLDTIFNVNKISDSFIPSVTPFNVYSKEMAFFMGLIPEEEVEEIQSQSYERYLQESRQLLESHSWFPENLSSSVSMNGTDRSKLLLHSINSDGQTWKCLLRLLSQFFANSVEINLILTRVFIELASCGWASLRGWMLVELSDVIVSHARPSKNCLGNEAAVADLMYSNKGDDAVLQSMVGYASDMSYSSSDDDYDEYWGTDPDDRYESTSFKALSPTMEVLLMLSKKMEEYRSKIPGFDDHLAERREMLQEDEDPLPDMAAVPFSSPSFTPVDSICDMDRDFSTFTLSPIDTQRRAEELLLSSSSLPSSPIPPDRSMLSSPASGSFRSGVLSRAGAYQQQQRKPSLPATFFSSPLHRSTRAVSMQHRRAESVASEFYEEPPETSSHHMGGNVRTHRRVRSSALSIRTTYGVGSNFTPTIDTDIAAATSASAASVTPTRPPKLQRSGSQDSLKAFESLMSSPMERSVSGSGVVGGSGPNPNALSLSAGSQSSFTTPRVLPVTSSPILQRTRSENENALSKEMSPVQLSEEIRDTFNNVSDSDSENIDNIAEDEIVEPEEESTELRRGPSPNKQTNQTPRMKSGIEMDDIVTDTGYVPAVIQVMGPETGKSRYVSVAHLLGNVIVYQEFVKELTALIQVRSTLIDQVDYGWQRRVRSKARRARR